jgi:hypothetical protein
MNYKIAQLILTPGKKANSISDIFIAQPDTAKEAMFGKIFILAEIEDNSSDSIKIINFVFEEINRNYYQNEKILLAEKIAAIKPEHIFEAALAKTNINLDEYIQNEKIKFNFSALNFTVGLIHEKNLHFTNTGKNKVLFIYKQKLKNDLKTPASIKKINNHMANEYSSYEYRVSDITKQTSEKNETGYEGKIFNNVVSGKILDSSSFFIGNEALPEYISNKQIVDIITTLPPTSAIEQFKLILSNINSYVPFLGILIKSSSSDKSDDSKKFIRQSSQESMINMNTTENVTENFLSPSGIIDFKKWLILPFGIFLKKKNAGNLTINSSLSLKDKIFFKRKTFTSSFLYKIFSVFKDILAYLLNFIIIAVKSLTSKEKMANLLSELISKIKNKTFNIVLLFKNLSRKNKILFVVSMSCLIIFIINLTVLKIKNTETAKQNEYKNLTSLIEQKQNQAEANLLYNNEEGAKKLFAEIKSMIDEYPRITEEQKNAYNEFLKKYNEQLEKIRRVTNVDPVILADFKNLTSLAQPENIISEASLEKIYAGDSSQKSIYIFDIKSKQMASATDLKQPIEFLKYPITAEAGSIYYLNNKNLIKLKTAKEELETIPLTFKNGVSGYSGLGIYNGNLYALDGLGGQIYKNNKNGNTFSAPTAWVTDNTDIKNGIDLAIDGSIYILKSNGDLIKFLKGKKSDFILDKIEPVLQKPTKIYISAEQKFIYIMEPESKRIVVYDKAGKYILQYYSDKFDDLKSFFPDEKNKLIYILNKTEILSFKATHL